MKNIELLKHLAVIEPLGAKLIEIEKRAEGDDFDKSPRGEVEISMPGNQPTSVGTVLASENLVFERIARRSIWLRAVVGRNELRDDRIAVFPFHLDSLQELDLCEMFYIERKRQHFITKEHVDNRQIDQHFEIQI